MKKILFSLCMILASVSAMAQSEKGAWNITLEGYGTSSVNKLENGDHDEAIGGDVAITYSVSDKVAVGLASGYYGPIGRSGSNAIPMMANVVLSFSGQSKITPLVDVRAGYLALTSTHKVKSYDGIALADYAVVQVMPGVSYSLSKTVDVNVKAVYAGYFKIGDKPGDTKQNFGLKAGVTFHF